MNDKAATIERCFNELVRAAVAGERCPINATKGLIRSDYVSELARAGRIRVEVSGHNWRTVVIRKGEHAGRSTMPNPNGHTPYRIIDDGPSDENFKRVAALRKQRREERAAELAREQGRPWP